MVAVHLYSRRITKTNHRHRRDVDLVIVLHGLSQRGTKWSENWPPVITQTNTGAGIVSILKNLICRRWLQTRKISLNRKETKKIS